MRAPVHRSSPSTPSKVLDIPVERSPRRIGAIRSLPFDSSFTVLLLLRRQWKRLECEQFSAPSAVVRASARNYCTAAASEAVAGEPRRPRDTFAAPPPPSSPLTPHNAPPLDTHPAARDRNERRRSADADASPVARSHRHPQAGPCHRCALRPAADPSWRHRRPALPTGLALSQREARA